LGKFAAGRPADRRIIVPQQTVKIVPLQRNAERKDDANVFKTPLNVPQSLTGEL
jgi:hypothetical protein